MIDDVVDAKDVFPLSQNLTSANLLHSAAIKERKSNKILAKIM